VHWVDNPFGTLADFFASERAGARGCAKYDGGVFVRKTERGLRFFPNNLSAPGGLRTAARDIARAKMLTRIQNQPPLIDAHPQRELPPDKSGGVFFHRRCHCNISGSVTSRRPDGSSFEYDTRSI